MSENEKENFLNQVAGAAEKRLVTKRELLSAYNEGLNKSPDSDALRSITLTTIFSSLGAGIIFLGIAILVAQNWVTLSSMNKIIITLGSGIVAYVMGFIFGRDARVRIVSASFFLLSALLIPLGLSVAFEVRGYDVYTSGIYSIISAISFLLFLGSYFIFKRELFLLFSILYGTWFFYNIVNFLYAGENSDFNLYCTIVVGLSYILLGSYFEKTTKTSLTAFLYGFGTLGFLGAIFALDLTHKGSICEWLFPLILFVIIYLSVRLRSTAFLTFGVVFLILDILNITEQYFSASLGWPVALVIAGFLLIIVAYLYFQLKKKYFR